MHPWLTSGTTAAFHNRSVSQYGWLHATWKKHSQDILKKVVERASFKAVSSRLQTSGAEVENHLSPIFILAPLHPGEGIRRAGGTFRPFPYPPSPFSPFPSLPSLKVGSLNAAREPQPKSNLVHFSLKIWHLVATISIVILMTIKWPNFSRCQISGGI